MSELGKNRIKWNIAVIHLFTTLYIFLSYIVIYKNIYKWKRMKLNEKQNEDISHNKIL